MKSQQTLDTYHDKFMCVDEDITLQGDFQSDITSIFKITLETCDREMRQCKSDDEITEWLRRKYIIVLAN